MDLELFFSEKNISLTDFSMRHFDKKFSGTKIKDFTPGAFEKEINLAVKDAIDIVNSADTELVASEDGYAPFCKLLVFSNFTKARTGSLPITLENYQYLRSGYSSRTDKELAVLSRWFSLPLPAPKANYLVVVVYDREQLEKEHDETNPGLPFTFVGDWGVVAILAQMGQDSEPMTPITMMRNSMGLKEGGSGHPINREEYEKAVKFWSDNAMIK